jgi:golgi-specific brefeldin A-resistance guanine nucleotide exchange factor 1
VFSVLRGTLGHSGAASMTFEFLLQLLSIQSELVTADNYSGIVLLLDEFASIASVVVDNHAQQRRREPPLTAAGSTVVERGAKSIDLLYDLKDSMSRVLQQTNLPQEQS